MPRVPTGQGELMTQSEDKFVWVFCGDGSRLPSAAFLSVEAAEAWIAKRGLSGLLTGYPIDQGAYDWAIERGFFTPKSEKHETASFIQGFSSAHLPHSHYVDGRLE